MQEMPLISDERSSIYLTVPLGFIARSIQRVTEQSLTGAGAVAVMLPAR